MKFNFKSISLVDLCSWFGVTRQAYYQRNVRALEIAVSDEVVLQMIKEVRNFHPRLGGRKLFKSGTDTKFFIIQKQGQRPFNFKTVIVTV